MVVVDEGCLSPPFLWSRELMDRTTLANRTIKATSAVPVIALTSTAGRLDPPRATGADAGSETPFELTDFMPALSTCVCANRRR